MTENTPGVPPPTPSETHETPHTGGPRVSSEEMRDLSRLRRSSTDKKVAGVAGGIGRHLDIDPVIVRVGFVVLAFFGAAGLLIYGAAWLLLPRDDEERATIDLDPRSRSVALIAVGVLALLAAVGDTFGGGSGFWLPIPLLVVGAITWWLLTRRDRKREKYAAAYAATYGLPAERPTTSGYAAAPGYVPPPRPRDPRKRGPRLFWITLPLIPLALGLLGMADVSGADVAASAYPALALGVVAAMLVLGAFWGRAGGLILLGLVATVATAGATASEHWDGDERHVTPHSAADVDDSYDLDGPGELVLDLTQVRDLPRLAGRTIELDAGVGRIEVIVPERVSVTVEAEVGGPGETSLFGRHEEGIHVKSQGANNAATPATSLHIDAFIGVGEIEVTAR